MYGSGQVRIVNRWLVIKPRLNSGILTTGGSSQNGTAENVGEIATYTTTATDRIYK